MRVEFSKSFLKLSENNNKVLLLTGDLGFMAFEEIKSSIGQRFINAGISEQNMITVAASLAKDGFIPFTYSIAPFLVGRAFEQIRNDVGLHGLPVKLIANGGGYGYGIMGSTHHAPDDLALMRCVQNMKIFIPTFSEDVEIALSLMLHNNAPSYLRLNATKNKTQTIPDFSTYRQLSAGKKAIIIGVGPVILNFCELNDLYNLDLEIWTCDQLPLNKLPDRLLDSINHCKHVILVEEHYQAGGFGEAFTCYFNQEHSSISKIKFNYFNIKGYLSGRYGSQKWHLEENSLAGEPLKEKLLTLLNE